MRIVFHPLRFLRINPYLADDVTIKIFSCCRAPIKSKFRRFQIRDSLRIFAISSRGTSSRFNRTCRNPDGSKIAGGNIALGSITYADLLQYDAGLFKGEQFKGTKVPLLSEAARLVAGTGVALKLDNKIQNYTDEQLEVIFQLAEASEADIGFTCKDMAFVERVAKRLPNATIHYDGPPVASVLNKLKAYAEGRELYVWIGISTANEKLCNQATEVGYLGIWTLGTEEELEKAVALGADIIETNGELKPPKS